MVKVNRKSRGVLTYEIPVKVEDTEVIFMVKKLNMFDLLDYELVCQTISREFASTNRVSKDSVKDLIHLLVSNIISVSGFTEEVDPGVEGPLDWDSLSSEDKENILADTLSFEAPTLLYKELGSVGRLTEEEKKS